MVAVVLVGAVLIAAIGFAGSYAAVRDLAERKGFGAFAPFFPIGVDAGIVVLLALDVLLTYLRIPFPLLRHTAWLLTAATIAFNASASYGDWLAMAMHGTVPALFVVTVEAARHAIGRLAHLSADTHMDSIRLARWVLAFPSTLLLFRQMKLWELRSYDEALRLRRDQLIYRTHLRARYGRGWRRRAPVAARLPLRLARYGVPLAKTAPEGFAAAGLPAKALGPLGLAAGPDPASWGARPAAGGSPDREQESHLRRAATGPLREEAGQGTAGQGTAGQGTAGQGTAGQGEAGEGTAVQGAAAARNEPRSRPAPGDGRTTPPPLTASPKERPGLEGPEEPEEPEALEATGTHEPGPEGGAENDAGHLPEEDGAPGEHTVPQPAPQGEPAPAPPAAAPEEGTALLHQPHQPHRGAGEVPAVPALPPAAAGELTIADRYYQGWIELTERLGEEPSLQDLSDHLWVRGVTGRGQLPISPSTLRRYRLGWRIYRVWAQHLETRGAEPSLPELEELCAEHGIKAKGDRGGPLTQGDLAGYLEDFRRRHALLAGRLVHRG
nr:DUF2637 domain-containing protein [Streptomyces albus]